MLGQAVSLNRRTRAYNVLQLLMCYSRFNGQWLYARTAAPHR
jgi:hypothetical protein